MQHSVALYLYSGYRDAQCGWLVVSDPSEISRRAQCLCIYASRRGILEVMYNHIHTHTHTNTHKLL